MENYSASFASWVPSSALYTPGDYQEVNYNGLGSSGMLPGSTSSNYILPARPLSAPYSLGDFGPSVGKSSGRTGQAEKTKPADDGGQSLRPGKPSTTLDSKVEKIRAMNTEVNPAFPRPDMSALATMPLPKSLVAATNSSGKASCFDKEKEKKTSLYKTELCRSFEVTGHCKYGNKCQFAHSDAELRGVDRHPKYKTELCKTFWEKGVCPYGKRCCFVHTSKDIEARKQQCRRYDTLQSHASASSSASCMASSVASLVSISPSHNQPLAEPAAIKAMAQEGQTVEQMLLPELSVLVSMLPTAVTAGKPLSAPSMTTPVVTQAALDLETVASTIPTPPPAVGDPFTRSHSLASTGVSSLELGGGVGWDRASSSVNHSIADASQSFRNTAFPSVTSMAVQHSESGVKPASGIQNGKSHLPGVESLASYFDSLALSEAKDKRVDKQGLPVNIFSAGSAPYIGFIATPPATPSPNLSFSSPENVSQLVEKNSPSKNDSLSELSAKTSLPLRSSPDALTDATLKIANSASGKRLRVFQHLKEEH